MRIEITNGHHLSVQRNGAADGVLNFPTTGCALAGEPCPSCCECYDDCLNCELCKDYGCTNCAVPDLTPRTANMLVIAGVTLGAHAGEQMFRSLQPVFLDHIVGAFERLTEELRRGRRPVPTCLAEQLCLHLMIAYATDLACDVGEAFNVGLPLSEYDYYFDRLYDTLLADEAHLVLLRTNRLAVNGIEIYDFTELAAQTPKPMIERLLLPFPEGAMAAP